MNYQNYLSGISLWLTSATLLWCSTISVQVLAQHPLYKTSVVPTQTVTVKLAQAERLFTQGVEQFNRRQFAQALQSWEAALAIYQQISRPGEAKTLKKLGDTHLKLNQYEPAFAFHQRYVALLSELEDKKAQAKALARLGDSYRSKQQYEQALAFHQQFLTITQELGEPQRTADALSRVGYTYFLAQQYPQALQLYQQSLQLRQELGDLQGQAQLLYWLGISYTQQGQDEPAVRFHQRSLAMYGELVEQAQVRETLRELGATLLRLGSDYFFYTGKHQPAIDFYQQALAIFQKLDDKAEEANILSSLGNLYLQAQQYEQAVEFHQQSLAMYRELGEGARLRGRLLSVGQVYTSQGQYELARKLYENYLAGVQDAGEKEEAAKVLFDLGELSSKAEKYASAIDFYQRSLAIFRELGILSEQLSPLRTLGDTYVQLKQYETAIDFYQQFLTITQEVYGRQSAADFMGRYLGRVFVQAQQYEQAIAFRLQAIEILRELGERQDEAITLKWLGDTYRQINQHQQAQEVYQQSLAIFQELKDSEWEIVVLQSLGDIFIETEQYQPAWEYYQQLITLLQKLGEQGKVASMLEKLGDTFLERDKDEQAREFHRQYLALISNSGDRLSEVAALNQLGKKYQQHQHYQSALVFYQQALRLSDELQKQPEFASFDLVGVTQGNLGALFAAQQQPELAIIFYKAAINNYETIRAKYSATEIISPGDNASLFLSRHEADYRNLADLLLQQDRIIEAQRVLDLLKVQELDDYLENVRQSQDSPHGVAERNPERSIREDSQAIFTEEILLSQELKKLEAIPVSQRNAAQKQRIRELRQAQIELVKQFNQFLDSPKVKAQIAQLQQATGGEGFNLAQARSLSDNLAQLEQGAVIIYPLILDERLELILITPDASPVRRTVAVTKAQLNQTILAARQVLTNRRRRDFTPLQQLYEWLIAPIEADLAQTETKTIIYAPDGQLRYIPLAALYDGKQWLAQRFAINHITALSLTELTTTPPGELRILAGALTQGRHSLLIGEHRFSFAGLPFAGVEVNNLATIVPSTTKRLDEEFNKDLIYEMADYGIVHLATHAYFVTGEPKDSFILFGDGEYATLREVENWSLNNVDLVVLSACETGVGDILGNGEEILGFGYQMQRAGAKAAMASLWQVSDGGTQMLMNAFYRSLTQGMTKAQALQAAQQALITGDFSGNESMRNSRNLEHPYYWAAFILIGNGL